MKKLKNYRPLMMAVAFAAFAWILVNVLSRRTYFTHEIYPDFYAWFYPIYTKAFGWIPFSIGDLFYFVLILLLIWTVILGIRCFVLGQKWRGIRILSRFIFSVSIFYLLFHLLWAFNYYKPNLGEQFRKIKVEDTRLKTKDENLDVSSYNVEELKFIANDLMGKSLTLRDSVKEDKNGVFKFRRKEFYRAMPSELKDAEKLKLGYTKIPKLSLKKYSLFSVLMRYFGVSGYYNPFTAEAQITRLAPDTSVPFSMAHEQAHQMGYATEYEANFIGFLTCIQSKNQSLAYSANYKALKYVLREIYPEDSAFVKQTLANFSEGMQRDYAAEKAYHQKYSGVADDAFSSMNNAYLKANRQQDGIESYNRFVELLAGYYRIMEIQP